MDRRRRVSGPAPDFDVADPSAPQAGEQGLGPAMASGYGGALASIGQTWLAGLPFLGVLLLSYALLVVGVVTVALVVGVGVVGLVPPSASVSWGLGVVSTGLLVYLVAALGLIALMFACLAPSMQAIYRAHARFILHEQPLGVMDGARGSFRSHSLNAWLAVALTLEYFGYMLLIVPGVVFAAATAFVVPAMVLDELSLLQALRRSLGHFFRAPMFHVALAFVDGLVMLAINSAIPFIGILLALPLSTQLHLRAYLEAFPREP